jgi:hypothetical protein
MQNTNSPVRLFWLEFGLLEDLSVGLLHAEDSNTGKSEDLCKKTPEGHADVAQFLMVQGKGVW